jgi:Protein of unknown function (DUF1524)
MASGAPAVVLTVTVDGAREYGFVTAHPCDTSRPNASVLNYAAGTTRANTVITRLDGRGRICLYTFGATDLIVDVTGTMPIDSFEALPAPARIMDTRPGGGTVDGGDAGVGVLTAGSTYALQVAGRAGVSFDSRAAVLNVTVDAAREYGFVTAYPCDSPPPNASNINFVAGSTVPNLVITGLDAQGRVCLYTFGATDLIVDVAGAIPRTTFTPLSAPRRLVDTRPGTTTFDGQFAGGGRRSFESTLAVPVAGRAGVPVGAAAVVLNVTADAAIDPGFVTVHPAGTNRPNASNLNYDSGATVAAAVIARLGPDGHVCVFNHGATHLIVDVVGVLSGPVPTGPGGCPTPPSDPLALDVLSLIPIANEQSSGYDRSLFPLWSDLDGDGCDTRQEVLIEESRTPVQRDPFGCAVVAGDWFSPYDGATWSNPADVDIDHVVALKEAWDSGAHAWTTERRELFANDLTDSRTLLAVTDSVNQSKGDADPSNWLPPLTGYVCTYLADWISIKARWGLSMDESEAGRIRNELTARCPSRTIAPWTPAPADGSPPPPPSPSCDAAYPTVCIPPPPPDLDCADVPYRNFVVLPPDPHHFDGNNDGIGCTT